MTGSLTSRSFALRHSPVGLSSSEQTAAIGKTPREHAPDFNDILSEN